MYVNRAENTSTTCLTNWTSLLGSRHCALVMKNLSPCGINNWNIRRIRPYNRSRTTLSILACSSYLAALCLATSYLSYLNMRMLSS